jgi:hypothetical protein
MISINIINWLILMEVQCIYYVVGIEFFYTSIATYMSDNRRCMSWQFDLLNYYRS